MAEGCRPLQRRGLPLFRLTVLLGLTVLLCLTVLLGLTVLLCLTVLPGSTVNSRRSD